MDRQNKMTVQHSNSLREGCKNLGCSDDECNKVDNHLAGVDVSSLDIGALIQLILQVVALFRKPQPAPAHEGPAQGSTMPK